MRISEQDYLMHHGVKGMRWGVRHDRVSKKQKARTRSPSVLQKTKDAWSNLSPMQKKIIKKTLVVVGYLAFAYAVTKLTPNVANRIQKNVIAPNAEKRVSDFTGAVVVNKAGEIVSDEVIERILKERGL